MECVLKSHGTSALDIVLAFLDSATATDTIGFIGLYCVNMVLTLIYLLIFITRSHKVNSLSELVLNVSELAPLEKDVRKSMWKSITFNFWLLGLAMCTAIVNSYVCIDMLSDKGLHLPGNRGLLDCVFLTIFEQCSPDIT